MGIQVVGWIQDPIGSTLAHIRTKSRRRPHLLLLFRLKREAFHQHSRLHTLQGNH